MTAAIYVRVSTAKQEDGSSLDTQEAACRAYAAEKGLSVGHVFREVYSGAHLYDRPRLNELRDLIRGGKVTALISYDLDRLTRNQAHIGMIATECDRHGCAMHFVREGEYGDDAIGKFLLNAKVFVAEFEREQILERTMRGKINRVEKQGKPLAAGKPPYGYVWEDERKERLVADPETAPVIQRIFRELVEGGTANGIANRLNAEGVPTPKQRPGGRWNASNICTMVRRRVYVGEYEAYRWRFKHNVSAREAHQRERGDTLPSKGIVLPGVAEPLVTVEEFEAAEHTIQRNRIESKRNSADPEDALLRAGYAYCGYCGRRAIAVRVQPSQLGTKQYPKDYGPHYACSPHNRKRFGCPSHKAFAARIDAAAWAFIVDKLANEETLRAELDARRQEDPTLHDRENARTRLAAVAKEERELTANLGRITNEAVLDSIIVRINELGVARSALEGEQAELERRREAYLDMEEHIGNVMAWVAAVRRYLTQPDLSYETKRRALHMLGVKVYLFKKDHPEGRMRIEFNLPIAGGVVHETDNSISAIRNVSSPCLALAWAA